MKLKWHVAQAIMTLGLWGLLPVLAPPGTLDARLYYTAQEAQALFAAYTPEQISAYVRTALVDLVFIISYTHLFYRVACQLNMNLSLLVFIPGVLDLVETTLILIALTVSPSVLALPLGWVTLMKWISVAVVVGSLTRCAYRLRLIQ